MTSSGTSPCNFVVGNIFLAQLMINFRYFKTTQQGADILGQVARAQVVMPDFAHGKPFSSERYLNPPEGADVRGEVGKQFFDPSYIQERLDEIKAVAQELRKEGKTFVGVGGGCTAEGIRT